MEQKMMRLITGEAALKRAASLFDGWEETLIWTALEGMMGQVWALQDDADPTPQVALCQTGDFVFLAGDAALPSAERLLMALKEHLQNRFAIITPQDDAWSKRIQQVFGDAVKAGERYAICKETDGFEPERLAYLAKQVPCGVTLVPIQGEIYDLVMQQDWSMDFCSQFAGKKHYEQDGLGIAALYGKELIGGASSYIRYREGIEIEVDTRSDWRRKGIATACCAELILRCLAKGHYPSWDAANRESVALAQKLGYREKGAYPVWFLNS